MMTALKQLVSNKGDVSSGNNQSTISTNSPATIDDWSELIIRPQSTTTVILSEASDIELCPISKIDQIHGECCSPLSSTTCECYFDVPESPLIVMSASPVMTGSLPNTLIPTRPQSSSNNVEKEKERIKAELVSSDVNILGGRLCMLFDLVEKLKWKIEEQEERIKILEECAKISSLNTKQLDPCCPVRTVMQELTNDLFSIGTEINTGIAKIMLAIFGV